MAVDKAIERVASAMDVAMATFAANGQAQTCWDTIISITDGEDAVKWVTVMPPPTIAGRILATEVALDW